MKRWSTVERKLCEKLENNSSRTQYIYKRWTQRFAEHCKAIKPCYIQQADYESFIRTLKHENACVRNQSKSALRFLDREILKTNSTIGAFYE